MSYGEMLRKARKKKKMAQADLAYMLRQQIPGCGCTPNIISQWERDVHLPRAFYRNALAEILEDDTLLDAEDAEYQE